jgi:hypothetical protein
MCLATGGLAESMESQNDYNLKHFEDVMSQLRWISTEQKEILAKTLSYTRIGRSSKYLTVLTSMSAEIELQVSDLTLSFTRSMLSGKSEKWCLEGKSYTLHKSVQKYYEILKLINNELSNN